MGKVERTAEGASYNRHAILRPRKVPVLDLPKDHPTSVAFLDETGSISADRFFAVGCLKLGEPSYLTRRIQALRDQWHWYDEIHWVDVTRKALPFYRLVVEEVASCPDAAFSCFVADRSRSDPVARFRTPSAAYARLAAQLLVGSIKPCEVVFVLADAYSTPADVCIELDIKRLVNKRFGRLAVSSVCRLDSKSADPLQVADLLTSAVAFEFRQSAGLASATSPKAKLMEYVFQCFGVTTVLGGARTSTLNVAQYQQSQWSLQVAGTA